MKEQDLHQLAIYEQQRSEGNLPLVEIYVPALSINSAISRLSRKRSITVPRSRPVPMLTWSEEDLLHAEHAWAVYSYYEQMIAPSRRSYLGLAGYITQMAVFVENVLEGNTQQLLNHILGVQLARRLICDLPDAPSPADFSNVCVLPGHGRTNKYSDMQGDVELPFYHPNQSIHTSWVTICADYRSLGRYEFILPGFVGIRLFGEVVANWHRDTFAPAHVAHDMTHRDYSRPEADDGFVDGQVILSHVYQAEVGRFRSDGRFCPSCEDDKLGIVFQCTCCYSPHSGRVSV